MDVDPPASSSKAVKNELKIRGQAELERRKSKWDDEDDGKVRSVPVLLQVLLLTLHP